MNRRMKIFMLLLIFGSSLLVVHKGVVHAAQNSILQYNFVGSTTALATVSTNAYPYHAVCSIQSATSPATTINVIGWTWWQCDLLNGSSIHGVVYGSPRAISSSSTADNITVYTPPGSGVTGFRSRGTHDFNHTGSNPSPWRPYNSVIH